MDNTGFQKKAKKVLPPRKLNGSFYDGVAPKGDYSKPVGQWNQAKLVCNGPIVSFDLNGKNAFRINLNDWKEAGKNPDGSDQQVQNRTQRPSANGTNWFSEPWTSRLV